MLTILVSIIYREVEKGGKVKKRNIVTNFINIKYFSKFGYLEIPLKNNENLKKRAT